MFEEVSYYGCIHLGNFLYECKDYQGAISNYTQAIELNPKEYTPYYSRGLTYNKIQDYRYAIEDFNQVSRLNPRYVPSYTQRAQARMQIGEIQKALEDCNRALQLDFSNIDARYWRGYARTYLGEYPGAIEDFKDLLGNNFTNFHNPNYYIGITPYNLGVLEYLQGNSSQAVRYLTKAIHIDPDSVFAYYLRGNAFYDLEDTKGAFEDFEEAKQIEIAGQELDNIEYQDSLDRGDEHGLYARGLALNRLEKPQEAIISLQQAQEIALKHQNTSFHQRITDLIEEIQPETDTQE